MGLCRRVSRASVPRLHGGEPRSRPPAGEKQVCSPLHGGEPFTWLAASPPELCSLRVLGLSGGSDRVDGLQAVFPAGAGWSQALQNRGLDLVLPFVGVSRALQECLLLCSSFPNPFWGEPDSSVTLTLALMFSPAITGVCGAATGALRPRVSILCFDEGKWLISRVRYQMVSPG